MERGEKEKAIRSHSESHFEFLIGRILASSRSIPLPKSSFCRRGGLDSFTHWELEEKLLVHDLWMIMIVLCVLKLLMS